jgi:hypothetical protein
VKVIAITGGNDMIGILNFLDVAKMLGSHSTLQKLVEMKTILDPIQAELQAYRVLKKSLFSPARPGMISPSRPDSGKTDSSPWGRVFSHAAFSHRSQES